MEYGNILYETGFSFICNEANGYGLALLRKVGYFTLTLKFGVKVKLLYA
jgi:hypothetical protein